MAATCDLNSSSSSDHNRRSKKGVSRCNSNSSSGSAADTAIYLYEQGLTSHTCHACHAPADTFIQCARCKLVNYCSVKCFNADLQSHSRFCSQTGVSKQQELTSASCHEFGRPPKRRGKKSSKKQVVIQDEEKEANEKCDPEPEQEKGATDEKNKADNSIGGSDEATLATFAEAKQDDERKPSAASLDGSVSLHVVRVSEETDEEDDEVEDIVYLSVHSVSTLNEDSLHFRVEVDDEDEEYEEIRCGAHSRVIPSGTFSLTDDDLYMNSSNSFHPTPTRLLSPKPMQQERLSLKHTETQANKGYGWERPEWLDRQASLRTTELGRGLRSESEHASRNFLEQSRSRIEWEKPEWVLKSPLKKTRKKLMPPRTEHGLNSSGAIVYKKPSRPVARRRSMF